MRLLSCPFPHFAQKRNGATHGVAFASPSARRMRRTLFSLAKAALLFWVAFAAVSSSAQESNHFIRITHWRMHWGDNPAWARPGFDDSPWPVIPGYPHLANFGPGGTRWYRATFRVPPGLTGQQLSLGMGPLGDVYDVYINGTLLGHWGSWQPSPQAPFPRPLAFPIPPGLLKGPMDHVAIRRWTGTPGLHWYWFALSGDFDFQHPPEIGQRAAINTKTRLIPSAGAVRHLPFDLYLVLYLFAASISFVLFTVHRRRVEFLFLSLYCLLWSAPSLIGIPIATSESIMARSWGPTVIQSCFASAGVFSLLFLAALCPRYRKILWFGAMLSGIFALIAAYSYADQSLVGTRISLNGSTYGQAFFDLIAVWGLFQQRSRGSSAIGGCLLLNAAAWGVAGAGRPVFGIPPVIQAGPFDIDFRTIPGLLFVFVTLLVLYLRFRDEQVRQAVLDQELAAARKMQEQLLTTGETLPAGFTVDAVYRPAREVGGDFYRTVPLEDGSLLVIVGDVSGKGLDASMLVAVIVGSLANETHRSPASLLAYLNRAVLGRTAGGFITACCARFYPDGRVVLANAGHISPYLEGRELQLENGLPLGITPLSTYSETEIHATGPITFLSDGVVEARNGTGELLGFERMAPLTVKPPAEIADAAQHWGQEDDITVLTVAATLA